MTDDARKALDALFRPRSVAVIGASRRDASIGREVLRNLVDYGFHGPVFPVNSRAAAVHSMKAYPTVESIPEDVDLAIVTVPRDAVLPVVRDCARKGVRGVVVITAGFREVDREGAELERAIVDTLREHDMRMVGPNCMGVINTEPGIRLDATFAAAVPERGNVGFISQSGALGEAILADAAQSGLGVAMFVSMGNKADVTGNDLLEYWEDNPDIDVVLMYLESFGGPKRFTSLARRVTRQKPVVAVKAGRTAAGARAASSHTGSIVGRDIAVESLLEQCGVLRVGSMDEMFVKAAALANQPLPADDRIAIVTNAGGPGILCTDACVAEGLALAELAPDTRDALAAELPAEASVENPVDMIASADAARYRAALARVAADPGVDGIIAIFVSPIMIDAYEVARAIAEVAGGAKPVLSVFMGKQRSDEGVEWLRRHRVPVYRFPEAAAQAMGALARYRALRDAPAGRAVSFEVDRQAASRAFASVRAAGREMLNTEEVEAVLEAYGIPYAPSRPVATAAEAIAAGLDLGYPVVLKIDSEVLTHKTDVGGVRVDLRNGDEVGTAFAELDRLRERDPALRIVVQPMIRGGREVILGATEDPQFGPLLMFGLGGVDVEVRRDVAVGIHPLTDVAARAMIEKIRGYPLLAGHRGEPPVDLAALEETLLRLSQLVGDFEDTIAELDLNPVVARPAPDGAIAVDARVRITHRD